MKKLIICSSLLLLMVSAGWGASITVRPTKSQGEIQWTETPGIPESTCVSDQSDKTSVGSGNAGVESGFAFPDFTDQYYFDSLQVFVRAKTTLTGTIALGWGCYSGSENYWGTCNWADSANGTCAFDTGRCSGADTITLTTTITDYWVITLLYNPRRIAKWDTLYYNNSTYGVTHTGLLNLYNVSVAAKNANYVYEIWGNLFYTPPNRRNNLIRKIMK